VSVPSSESSRPGEVFDSVAEAYDDVRSGYPDGLVAAALARGGLGLGSRVVEVGCGTGKLTELLVARDLRIDAVDPGPRMIDVARRRVSGSELVRFHVGRFEDVDLPTGSFDAVFSATAFHWIDPAVGWHKAATLLRPGGLLALLTHRGVADGKTAGFDEGFRKLWLTHAPNEPSWPRLRDMETLLTDLDRVRGNVSEVWNELNDGRHGLAVAEAVELFEEADVLAEVETGDETAEQALALLRTTSSYLRIEPGRRGAFEADVRAMYARLGGSSRVPLLTVLVTARRRGDGD
jgi:SAM-dependent methyltransferase